MATFSSFYLLYLREARIPIDLAMENVGELYRPTGMSDYVTDAKQDGTSL